MRTPRSIIHLALVTEKGTRLRRAGNMYLFEVARDANKIEIGRAIEAIFNVKVLRVRTMNVHGKPKTLGRFQGQRPAWKKAIVTLGKGSKIDLFDEV